MTATGPHKNTYIIPNLVLGDTFHDWFEATNNRVIDKLNRLKVYTGIGATGISASTNDAGQLTVFIDDVIPGDHTFTGNITFNGSTTTINSSEVTIDDYLLVLGHTGSFGTTAGYADSVIGEGGFLLLGTEGNKEFVWRYPIDAWVSTESIALTGGKGFASTVNEIRFVETHASGISSGLQLGFTSGLSADNNDIVGSYVPVGGTVDVSHETFRITPEGFVDIKNGVNRKRIYQPSHGFTFGHVVRRTSDTLASLGNSGGYTLSIATSPQEAESIGMVSHVVNSDYFDITMFGEVHLGTGDSWSTGLVSGSTLSPGHAYFLSKDVAGKLTTTPPVQPGHVRKVVFVALDEEKALVTNYIGHEIPDESIITNLAYSNRKLVVQKNNFQEGDIVRFDPSKKYGLSGAGDLEDTSILYNDGTYVRASADTPEDAEVIGIVTDTSVAGDPDKFFVTTSGFFVLENGLTGISGGISAGVTAGTVYYLNSGATSYGSVQLNVDSPNTAGHVAKPLLVTTSANSGFFTNYIGTVVTNDSAQIIGSRVILQERTDNGKYPGDGSNGGRGRSFPEECCYGPVVALDTIQVSTDNSDTFTYYRRNLNTKVFDANNIVTLGSQTGQFTLNQPGKYIIRGWYGDHNNANLGSQKSVSNLRLYNVSGATLEQTLQPFTYNPENQSSTFEGGPRPFEFFVEVPSGTKTLEIQHGSNRHMNNSTFGFPHAQNGGEEIYAHVDIEYIGLN